MIGKYLICLIIERKIKYKHQKKKKMNNFTNLEKKNIKEFRHLNEWPEKQFDYEIRQKHLTPYIEKRMELYRAQDKDFFTKQYDKECYYLIKYKLIYLI